MPTPEKERPWWLRLDGVPPSRERRQRQRWPDWDQISGDERVRRQQKRMREWMVDHRWLTFALLVFLASSVVRNSISMFTKGDRHATIAVYYAANAATSFLVGWWWLREFRRGLRGD